MSWKKTSVGEIITTKKGFAFKSSKYVNKGVPIVRVSDYTLDSISDTDLKYYPYEEKQNYIDFELHEKDVIVQTVGSWQNNPASVVGKVVRVPYFLDGALLNQNAVKLTPIDGVDNNFLFYRLKTDEFKGHVLGEARGAANQASITLDTIKSFEFLIPDYPMQKRIGEILGSYDALIENNQKQIKLLEEAAQRLYKEWFVNLRFPGYEKTEIVDGVPSGWKKTVLNEVFSFERGKSYASKELSDSEGVVLVNLKNIQAWGGYKREAEKRFIGKYKESQTVEFGDIVMAVTDMTQERRLVGHVALVPDLGEKATYSMDLIKLIPSKGINSFFLYSSLRYSGIAENISKHANGTNVLHLKPDSIMGLEYIIPSAELMDLFGSMVETICKKVEVLQSQMILLSNARDRLLPKLMSGEIEV